MKICIPEWLGNSKRIDSYNCVRLYGENLSKKLGVKYLSYKNLKKEVRKAKINSRKEYTKKRKSNWASNPHRHYKEWINWDEFLGRERFNCNYIRAISYEQLKKEVKKAGIKSYADYQKRKKPNWPSIPKEVYKEWTNWYDFLGKEKIEYLDYKDLQKAARKEGVRSVDDYKEKRKVNWPSNPHRHYKEWTDWGNFLGKKKIDISYKQLQKEVAKIGIKSYAEYKQKRKPNWPKCPSRFYEKEWKGWGDFMGKKKVEKPSKTELSKVLWTKPSTHIAKDYNVSDFTIHNWADSYGLKKPPRGYWASRLK
jgi:uncharacterized short protein YbdD (DUF466 family)